MSPSSVLTTVLGRPISVDDVNVLLKARGIYRAAIYDLIECEVVRVKAAEHGADVSSDDLARFLDLENQRLNLHDPKVMENYLLDNGISEEDWRSLVFAAALKEKLKDMVIDEVKVRAFFESDRDRFAHANVARLTCEDRARLDDVRARLDDGEEFSSLVEKYSVDRFTRYSGGYLGEVRKGLFPPEIDAAIFAAEDDEVVGPFEENGFWSIFKVFSRHNGEMTESTEQWIRDHLFAEWLREEVHRVPA